MSSAKGGSAFNSYSAAARSLPAFENHARTSVSSAGSCGMEQLAFAKNRGGEGRGEVCPAVELTRRPDQHIRRNAGSPKNLVGGATAAKFCWRIVGHNEHDVVIAVGTGVTPRNRSEEI